MSAAGYVRRAHRVVYENAWLRFEAHDMVHPTGVAGEHGLVIAPRASAVVLLDGDDVLLTRQPRFGVDRVVLEVIKGGRHAGEDALACAQRESREEAGVAAKRWIALGETFEVPSIMREPVDVFLALDLHAAPLPPEAVERIDIVRMRFDDAFDACARGEIPDAITAVALLRATRAMAAHPSTSSG